MTEIEALLSNLMLINTFTIGFIINFINNLNYQDLVDLDKRFFTTWPASTTVWDIDAPESVNDVIIISQVLCMRCWTSLICLSISMFISVGLIVGFYNSECKYDYDVFKYWIVPARFLIFTAYALFLTGSIFLYGATTVFSYGNFKGKKRLFRQTIDDAHSFLSRDETQEEMEKRAREEATKSFYKAFEKKLQMLNQEPLTMKEQKGLGRR